MRRRVLLTTLGAVTVAGCQTTPSDGKTPTDPDWGTRTESPTPHEDDPLAGWASLVTLETIDRTYALGPTRYRTDDGGRIQLRFTATATADHPATVTATLENGNDFANTFRLRWTPPFGEVASARPRPLGDRHGGSDHDAGLVFAPTENHDLVDESPDLERDTDGLWRLADESVSLPDTIRLDAGERVQGEYALVGRTDGRGRPTGVCEFSRAEDRPVRVSVWRTSEPGPTRESRFAGTDLPPVSGETTTWFHEADATTRTFVRPNTERTDLPARITFTFVNRSRGEIGCGHWNLYKLVDGAWFHLGPFVHTADCRIVQPGGAKRWALRAAHGAMAPCETQAYPFLGGGRYGIVSGYGDDSGRTGAVVAIDAPPVVVQPTDDVRVERADGVVTGTSDRWRTAPDAENRARARLVLERTDTADRQLIAEQLMRDRLRGLRTLVALADSDADRVILRTDDRTADRAVGHDADASARFRYDDTSYLVSRTSP